MMAKGNVLIANLPLISTSLSTLANAGWVMIIQARKIISPQVRLKDGMMRLGRSALKIRMTLKDPNSCNRQFTFKFFEDVYGVPDQAWKHPDFYLGMLANRELIPAIGQHYNKMVLGNSQWVSKQEVIEIARTDLNQDPPVTIRDFTLANFMTQFSEYEILKFMNDRRRETLVVPEKILPEEVVTEENLGAKIIPFPDRSASKSLEFEDIIASIL